MDQSPGASRNSRERRLGLLQLVRDHGELAPTQLDGLLSVSLETVRRDLRILESQGLVRRSYGRVFPVESGVFETPLSVRSHINPEEKMRIAAAVVEQIRDAQLARGHEKVPTDGHQEVPTPRLI